MIDLAYEQSERGGILERGFKTEVENTPLTGICDTLRAAAEVAAWYAARTVGVGLTIEAKARGTWGNAITLAKASANLSVSGATLSGGTDGAHTLDFETGRQTFGVAADQWAPDNTNGLTAVEDVVSSEWGLFWQARDGTFIFRDRDYVFKRTAAAAALTVK